MSPDAYLAAERQSQQKSEYVEGVTYAMAGATEQHDTLAGNFYRFLGNAFDDRPCRVFTSDMKVCIETMNRFYYPDLSALCDAPQFYDEARDALLNPTLLVEVLFDSTEAYDRGDKFSAYRRLPSLRTYVLVSQKRVSVELFSSNPSGIWEITRPLESLSDELLLNDFQVKVPLTALYHKVNIEKR